MTAAEADVAALPERTARVIHALMETITQAGGGPVTAREVMIYDEKALTVQATAAALFAAMTGRGLADRLGPGLWTATGEAWRLRRALEDRLLS
jgi:chorismate-pyruvate lyase